MSGKGLMTLHEHSMGMCRSRLRKKSPASRISSIGPAATSRTVGGTTRVGGDQEAPRKLSDWRSELELSLPLFMASQQSTISTKEDGADGGTPGATLGAIRVVVEAGWIARVAALQVACIDTHRSCRGCQSFRLRIARKTPRKVYENFAGGGDGVRVSTGKQSSRVVLPRVVRLLYDLNKFDLKPGLRLPLEILSIVFGTAFGDSIDSIVWPPGLESVVFWRR